jgi:hypothetical protein
MINKSKSDKKRRSWVPLITVIAIIAIAVANIIIWKNYFGVKSEIEVLQDEVALVSQQIAQAAQPPANLESELEKAQSDLVAALQVFPVKVDKTDVIDFILTTAKACDVQIIPLISEGLKTSDTGQSYVILKYSGTVTGKLNNATNFITMLRNGEYSTMIITECVIDRITEPESTVTGSEIEVAIDLSFALYATSILDSKDTIL